MYLDFPRELNKFQIMKVTVDFGGLESIQKMPSEKFEGTESQRSELRSSRQDTNENS